MRLKIDTIIKAINSSTWRWQDLRRRSVTLMLIITFCFAWQPPLLAEEAPLVMGVFPRKGFTRAIEDFSALAEYLQARLGRKVILKSARNFAEFWQGVELGQYDLVHYNQYHYVRSHKELGYEVIAKNEEHHQATISGVLIVRKDSGFQHVEDLRGKKIIFGGGRDAMQSYIVASYLLQQAGLAKGSYKTVFSESPPNAIFATYFRQAAAAGSGNTNLDIPVIKERIDVSQLEILVQSEKLPQLPWAVKSTLPQTLKTHLGKLLTSLDESKKGREVLQHAGLTAIRPAVDKDYDPDRRIIQTVLGESY